MCDMCEHFIIDYNWAKKTDWAPMNEYDSKVYAVNKEGKLFVYEEEKNELVQLYECPKCGKNIKELLLGINPYKHMWQKLKEHLFELKTLYEPVNGIPVREKDIARYLAYKNIEDKMQELEKGESND